ncbi:arylesterase [Vandammella animalimorsus]|uniref:Arylesterase n=1 Tax=Vandammella animalimorsus TaxID=2029117 RepID=A0A2A2APA1_9BURK|nr:arylesterase [Vandammella animalimorsus]PAT39542.1 arylesterase [Vandammella animalimorsus]
MKHTTSGPRHRRAAAFDPARRRTLRWATAAAAAPALLAALAACGRRRAKAQPVPTGAAVLALGDSLTQGVGASAEQAFPALLAQATGWQVVNAGVSGDTSAQALARLPGLLQQHRPQLVIVGIGGNDFLRRQSTSQTKQNITRIVQACLDAGAQVLLVAIPGLGLLATAGLLSDHAMYEEIADELGVPLLAHAWAQVLSEPQLRSDQIHANAQGYAVFADKLLAGLRAQGLLR